jgi:hypothetical protein
VSEKVGGVCPRNAGALGLVASAHGPPVWPPVEPQVEQGGEVHGGDAMVEPDAVALDAGIVELIQALWALGVETVQSCEGGPGADGVVNTAWVSFSDNDQTAGGTR